MLSETFKTVKTQLMGFITSFTNTENRKDTHLVLTAPHATTTGIRDVASWLQHEKFLNFTDMEISVPMGLNVSVKEYLNVLEKLWNDFFSELDESLLLPVSRNLGYVANNAEAAKTFLTIRRLNSSYHLYCRDVVEIKDILSKCVDGKRIDKRKFGFAFNSASDYETVMVRLLTFREQIKSSKMVDFNRVMEAIDNSVEQILENELDSKLAEHLSNEVLSASKWIEFYGVFLLAVDELTNSMRATHDKIKSLSEK